MDISATEGDCRLSARPAIKDICFITNTLAARLYVFVCDKYYLINTIFMHTGTCNMVFMQSDAVTTVTPRELRSPQPSAPPPPLGPGHNIQRGDSRRAQRTHKHHQSINTTMLNVNICRLSAPTACKISGTPAHAPAPAHAVTLRCRSSLQVVPRAAGSGHHAVAVGRGRRVHARHHAAAVRWCHGSGRCKGTE